MRDGSQHREAGQFLLDVKSAWTMRERLNAGSVSVLLVLVTKTSTAQNHCAKVVSTTLGLCYVKQCEAKQQTHRKQDKPKLATLC